MKNSKQSKILSVLVILNVLLLILFLWVFSSRQTLQEESDRYQSNTYVSVMNRLDNLYELYNELSQAVSDAAQAPDDAELRVRLAGVLEGVTIGDRRIKWTSAFEAYTERYSDRDLELSGSIRDQMQAVQNSLTFSDETIAAVSAISVEELEAVAEIYSQLSQCFYRADGNFGELFMQREFYCNEFNVSRQKIDNLLAQLKYIIGQE